MIYQPGLSVVNQLVAKASQVTQFRAEDIRGPGREAALCHVRFAVMDIAHRKGLSLKRIGTHLNRHHTTVMDGVRRADELRTDPDFSKLLLRIDGPEASAIEARSDATGTGAAEGERAAPKGGDAQP